MITRHNMFEPLVEAVPSFRHQRDAFVAYWTSPENVDGYPVGDLPNYLLLAELATYFVDQLQIGETQEVVAGLGVCEQWLIKGDDYVREAATVGLLESLQNRVEVQQLPEERITTLLGREGLRWWEKLKDFWSSGKLLVDDPN